MKVLKRVKMGPVNAMPGDSVSLHYRDGHGVESVVTSHTLDEARTFDAAAIFELEADEAALLGMSDGIGGAFGKAVAE